MNIICLFLGHKYRRSRRCFWLNCLRCDKNMVKQIDADIKYENRRLKNKNK